MRIKVLKYWKPGFTDWPNVCCFFKQAGWYIEAAKTCWKTRCSIIIKACRRETAKCKKSYLYSIDDINADSEWIPKLMLLTTVRNQELSKKPLLFLYYWYKATLILICLFIDYQKTLLYFGNFLIAIWCFVYIFFHLS